MSDNDLPYRQFIQVYGETFRKAVYGALLSMFNDTIRLHYSVTGIAEMPDDTYVIRLERDVIKELFPKCD